MTNPIEAAPNPRPAVVTVARLLTFTAGGLLAIAGIAFLQIALTSTATVTDTNNSQNLTDAQANQALHILGVVAALFFFVLVAGQLTAGFLLGRANNAGRVVAWIADGLTLLCCGCGLGTSLLGNGQMSSTSTDANQSIRLTAGSSSGPLGIVVFGAAALAMLAAIAVVVLLVLPDANDYFRKQAVVWTPTQWSGDQGPYGPGSYGPAPGQAPYGGPSQPAGGWQPPPLPPAAPLPPQAPLPPAAPPPAIPQPPLAPLQLPPPPADPTSPPPEPR